MQARLFNKLGIEVTANVRHYLESKGMNRQKRVYKSRTKEHKKLVKKKYYDDLRKAEAHAHTSRAKRDGTYKPGQIMDGEGDPDDPLNPPPKKKKRTTSDAVCKHCGLRADMSVKPAKPACFTLRPSPWQWSPLSLQKT